MNKIVKVPNTIYVYSQLGKKIGDDILRKMPEIHIKNVCPKIFFEKEEEEKEKSKKPCKASSNCSSTVSTDSDNEFTEFLNNAEIIISDGELLSKIYEKLKKAQWVMGTWAGVEGMVDAVKNGTRPNFVYTRFANQRFGQRMAEYVLSWIINIERDSMELRHFQLQKRWVENHNDAKARSLQELTIAVLGTGEMGSSVINALKYFGSQVLAYGRSPSPSKRLPLDGYYNTKAELQELFKDCDYIVNTLPSTTDTKGLLGGNVLSYARKSAVFVNVGRGDVVSEAEVLAALDAGWLGGAVLDVFEEEPLPPTSRLWTHPKVIVTPHVSAESKPSDIADAFSANYERLRRGQTLSHIVDFDRGY